MASDSRRAGGVSPPSSQLGGLTPPARLNIVPLVAVALLTAFALFQARATNNLPDFFIYRLGAVLAARDENPYDIAKVRSHVAQQFPTPDPKPESLVNNCGYFLPPQAVVLYLPFAMLPYDIAKVAWALVVGVAGLAIATLPKLLRREGDPPPASGLVAQLVPFLLLLNFFTLAVVIVGQVAVVSVGCVAAGMWCFSRGSCLALIVGCVLWAVPFVKPHVALPLIPLAWYLYGWKRAAGVLFVVVVLNLIGATLAGGSPLFLRDYLDYLSASHRAVLFNRAELNYEMTSWNRLLYVATRPFAGNRFLVEQTATTAVASYMVWLGLVLGRCAISLGGTPRGFPPNPPPVSNVKPSAAWATVAAAAGAVWCPQVLGYEALMLLLAVPWVRELFTDGRRVWAWLAVALLVLQVVPFPMFQQIGFEFHRPLGVALFALLVLTGPLGAKPPASSNGPPG